MSKENFATRVLTLIADEYGVGVESLAQHRAALEAAADTEASITDDELKQLLSGTDGAVGGKFPKLDAVSLSIVEELERKDLDTPDEEEDEDDEDEDDEDEEEDEDDDD